MNPLKKAKRNVKRSVAIKTGIPTTKSGRKKKADAIQGQVVFWLVLVVLLYFVSGNSDAGLFSTTAQSMGV